VRPDGDEPIRITMPDGRVIAYETHGDPHGVPVVYLHGVPGSRLRRPLDPNLWTRLGIHAITYDRPGYGASSRQPGRSVADCVDDVTAIADDAGAESFCVLGISGGGPHALAVAHYRPRRVRAAGLFLPFAPIVDDELAALVPTNREAHERARRGGLEALAEQIGPLREQLLSDPAAQLRAMVTGVSASVDVDGIAAAVARSASAIADGIRPGPGGWIDDAYALQLCWGFTPSPTGCPVAVWFVEDDAATPASAVRRLAASVQAQHVVAWPEGGHLSSTLREEQVLLELIVLAGGSST
jgi:pimeloyl-ACP methyl ester carboxylesterase